MSDNTHPEIVELRHRVMVLEGQLRSMRTFADFFIDEFCADPSGVGDWAAQGGEDIDALVELATRMR